MRCSSYLTLAALQNHNTDHNTLQYILTHKKVNNFISLLLVFLGPYSFPFPVSSYRYLEFPLFRVLIDGLTTVILVFYQYVLVCYIKLVEILYTKVRLIHINELATLFLLCWPFQEHIIFSFPVSFLTSLEFAHSLGS